MNFRPLVSEFELRSPLLCSQENFNSLNYYFSLIGSVFFLFLRSIDLFVYFC